MNIKFSSFILSLIISSYAYAEKIPDWGVLSVCADPNSMPLSNIREEGFENKLAEILANDLGWELKFEWFPQRLAFFRNTIRAKDSSSPSGYKCDVAMGASPDPEGASGTKSYYTSTWVVVLPNTKNLSQIKSSNDLQLIVLSISLISSLRGPICLLAKLFVSIIFYSCFKKFS